MECLIECFPDNEQISGFMFWPMTIQGVRILVIHVYVVQLCIHFVRRHAKGQPYSMSAIVVNSFYSFCNTINVERYFSYGLFIYLNAKVSQPFNICVFFSMVQVRIFI